MIVIRSWATNLFGFKDPDDGVPPDIGERAVSGGWKHHNGVRTDPPSNALEILQRNGAGNRPGKTHNIIYARIWPRVVGKPACWRIWPTKPGLRPPWDRTARTNSTSRAPWACASGSPRTKH